MRLAIITLLLLGGCDAGLPAPRQWNTYHLGWFVSRRAHHISTTMDAWNMGYQVTGYDDSGQVIWFRSNVPSVTVTMADAK